MKKIRLKLHDGRQITATVSEGPYYTPVSWSNGERTTGNLGVVVDATKSEDYRWLNEEQNGRIEISADERRGWKPPFASTWRMYDTDGVTTDDHWIALGTVLDVDTGAS